MVLVLKLLHIIALTLWVAGLLYLPRLFAQQRPGVATEEARRLNALEHRVYFEVLTPAAILAVVFGSLLLLWGFEGMWLPVKLSFVMMLVVFHLYCGRLVLQHSKHRFTHGAGYVFLLNLVPVPLAVVIVALAVVKPV